LRRRKEGEEEEWVRGRANLNRWENYREVKELLLSKQKKIQQIRKLLKKWITLQIFQRVKARLRT
jgi:hypothetical protein